MELTIGISSAKTTSKELRPQLLSPERGLIQDFARGLMLLLIVVSNTQFFLWAAEHGPSGWHPVDGHLLDSIAQFLMITFLDLRVFPLFAFLFGYGMMQVYQRHLDAGASPSAAVAVLRRRSVWLIVFGFAHGVLLLGGDILGAYGLMSLVLGALFLRRSARAFLIAASVAVFLLVLLVVNGAVPLLVGADVPPAAPVAEAYASGTATWTASIVPRVTTWLGVTLGGGLLGFGFHAAVLLGFWAARKRVLEAPEHHLSMLRRVAFGGIAVGALGGLPAALAHLGILDVPATAQVQYGLLFSIQSLTGVAGGLGYAAAIVLLVRRFPAKVRESVPIAAVAASGKRALSSYLAHSVLFVPSLAAWGFGLGAHLGSATMVLFACMVWVVIVLVAYGLDRAKHPGPAELALRRLSYRTSLPS